MDNKTIKHLALRLWIIPLLVFLASCVRHRDITPYKSGKADHMIYAIDTTLNYKLIKGDKIGVQVINRTGEEVDIFNKQIATQPQGGTTTGTQLQGYDIDMYGFIDLPMIGKIHVEGLTIFQVDSLIESELSQYLAFAYVKTAILSFKVTFLGEFRAPQTVINNFAEVNILQAIGMVGDFTDYADRSKVKVYRKNGKGEYEMYMLNLSGDGIFRASQFYLQPNDVVYVQALKVKVVKLNSPTVSLVFSILAFGLVLIGYTKII